MTMKDIDFRLQWTIDSECFVFSRSSNQWTHGRIANVTVDDGTNTEWMRVQYGDKKRKKQIQRFSDCAKPKGSASGLIRNTHSRFPNLKVSLIS